MKVKETIVRDCCQPQDFKAYRGIVLGKSKYKFCVHCGQVYLETSSLDPMGNREYGWDVVRFAE